MDTNKTQTAETTEQIDRKRANLMLLVDINGNQLRGVYDGELAPVMPSDWAESVEHDAY